MKVSTHNTTGYSAVVTAEGCGVSVTLWIDLQDRLAEVIIGAAVIGEVLAPDNTADRQPWGGVSTTHPDGVAEAALVMGY